MRIIVTLCALVLVAGCASHQPYYDSINAANAKMVEAIQAKAAADAARYKAIAEIASTSADPSARVAAVMAMALTGQSEQRQIAPVVAQQPAASEALQWAQVLAQPLTYLGSGYYNMRIQTNASNNAMLLGRSTNETFGAMGTTIGNVGLGMGHLIPQPGATYNYTASGGSVAGGGSIATTTTSDRHDVTDNHSQTATPTVVQPQPGRICAPDAGGVMVCQ